MDGDRMKKLYMAAIDGKMPIFESDEEKEFYQRIRVEIEEKEAKGEKVIWYIPFD